VSRIPGGAAEAAMSSFGFLSLLASESEARAPPVKYGAARRPYA